MLIVSFSLLINNIIIEIEGYANQKTCVEDMFEEGEPIAIKGRIYQDMRTSNYFVAVSVESKEGIQFEFKRFEGFDMVVNIAHNCQKTQTLKVCVENYENYDVFVELDIKRSIHLKPEERVPFVTDYSAIDQNSESILDHLTTTKTYLEQTGEFLEDIIDKEMKFGDTIFFLGVGILIALVTISIVQLKIIQREMRRKKLY